MHNNKGFALITAVMVLCILSITGVLAMKRSIREVKSAAKFQFDTMGFYAAEAGIYHAAAEAKALALDDYFTEPEMFHNFISGSLGHLTSYSADVEVLNTVEFYTLIPDIRVKSHGKQAKGVSSIIEAEFEFVPAFNIPSAPIWAQDSVSLTGSSVVDSNYRRCEGEVDVPEVVFSDAPEATQFDFSSDSRCADGECNSVPNMMAFDMSLVDSLQADVYNDLSDVESFGTSTDPKIIRISGDAHINNSDAFTGYGILIIDNDFFINGGIEWYGLVVVKGTLQANGNADIYGSVVVGESDGLEVDILGNFEIHYDCEALHSLYVLKSGYRMKWWLNQLPKITALPSGAIIRR